MKEKLFFENISILLLLDFVTPLAVYALLSSLAYFEAGLHLLVEPGDCD